MQEQSKENIDAEAAVAFRDDLVKRHIGHRLFRVVSKLTGQRVTHYAAASLVKVICTALSCDTAVEDSVEDLRENLHRILDSKEAPPTKDTVYLSNVFCSSCSVATNIDVGDQLSWTCKECGQPLVKSTIDETIAERLNTQITAYQLQDHVCSKCKSVSCYLPLISLIFPPSPKILTPSDSPGQYFKILRLLRHVCEHNRRS
ncbi:hypothetical protein OESDEN_07985 [Oesophagostomum dentatum]|uniref:DNA polymerase epsilon catalytic subunit n=1 Tax=Oesophagostomum dentatum TaxID=61180 RepID=A0A0B1T7Q9_OESDE|nr:hypothetical protein OESDEN_07985 [Oesophagostomum dentatum]